MFPRCARGLGLTEADLRAWPALIRFEDVEPDVCNKYDVANTGYRSCLMA